MPEGVRSGKPLAGAAVMLRHCAADIFRKAEWLDSGAGTCYNADMAKQRKPVAKGAKVGGFVVGRARFAKISAVEGIELTQVMEERASEACRKGLTAEEYRRTIVRGYRKD